MGSSQQSTELPAGIAPRNDVLQPSNYRTVPLELPDILHSFLEHGDFGFDA